MSTPQPPQQPPQLRLRAQSDADIALLSSLCQDAITKRADLFYDKPARRFVMIANRFCWEAELNARKWYQPRPQPMRTRSAVRFDYVDSVQYRGPLQGADDMPLNLLAVTLQQDTVLHLDFSQGMALALTCEVIDITLDDLSAPWTVKSRPHHKT